MGPLPPQNNAEPSRAVAALVDEFFERRRTGEELTPERFVAEHPDMAEELRPYLAGLPLIDRACTSGGDAAARKSPGGATGLPTIEGFDLIEEIGRGGMGVIYKARQLSTKRIVALKVISGGPFASESALRRFDREVELAARLQHPSIVRILESGEVAGQKYYAMDYVDGVRLDNYVVSTQADVRTILRILERICEAVDYAHTHGVIHRDLKPGNVLIDDEGNPYILDFGLAKATDQADTEEVLTAYVSLPGQVLGTLFYLSPEQAAGAPDEIDARTDVYALGVMLFGALTGSLPFDKTGRPSQVIQRILESPPTRPSSLSERVDDEVETIILKALEKDKTRRYESAKTMAEDIRRYLEGEPILAKRPSSFYLLRKKVLKHRWAAALGATVVILSLIGLLAGSRWRHRELERARWLALSLQRKVEGGVVSDTVARAGAAYERYPRLPEAQLAWAQAQYRADGQDAARIHLEAELQRDPAQWWCRLLQADIYRAWGDAENAAKLQERAEHDAPDTAQAWYVRSFATLELDRAVQCAQETVKRNPNHILGWWRLAWLRLKSKDFDAAARCADQLIKLEGDHITNTVFKGHVLLRQGRGPEAIKLYTEAIRGQPTTSQYGHRANAYRLLRDYEKAVADYTAAIEVASELTSKAWYHYHRATPLWIMGREEEAAEDCRQARILLGQASYADARRFIILRELGRGDEAEKVLNDARYDAEDAWLKQILQCLANALAPEDLVADAVKRDNLEHLCEARYYAGESCLLSDRLADARMWFEKCVATGVVFDLDVPTTPMSEYELAQWRLRTLFGDNPPSAESEKN